MCKIETDVLLKSEGNIPIAIIRASYNWQEVLLNNLPFLITIVIISVAAFVTYRSNRASVEAQNEIASKSRQEEHENKISEFRHHWLQEVRETCSELIQIIHECQYFTKIQNSYHEQAKNPDKEVIKIFDLLQSVKSKIGSEEVHSLDDEVIQEITSELQTVLKTEWEVTKNRTWLKST